jgi:signal transduction histidine kinase
VLDVPATPMLAVCDPNRLTQVLTNLVDNAVRFSAKGSYVQVRISAVPDPPAQAPRLPSSPDGFILIAVSDSGPGIDDVQKEGIFTSFQQVKQGKKTLGQSLGLGLAISRALVEAHRGTIWVEDNTNGGSVFCVLLPRFLQESRLDRAS